MALKMALKTKTAIIVHTASLYFFLFDILLLHGQHFIIKEAVWLPNINHCVIQFLASLVQPSA